MLTTRKDPSAARALKLDKRTALDGFLGKAQLRSNRRRTLRRMLRLLFYQTVCVCVCVEANDNNRKKGKTIKGKERHAHGSPLSSLDSVLVR